MAAEDWLPVTGLECTLADPNTRQRRVLAPVTGSMPDMRRNDMQRHVGWASCPWVRKAGSCARGGREGRGENKPAAACMSCSPCRAGASAPEVEASSARSRGAGGGTAVGRASDLRR